MAKQEMATKRKTFYCSSSISNFRDKLKDRLGIPTVQSPTDETIFFGLYHIKDFIKFFRHKGEKRIFWCGGDILNLEKNPMRFALVHFLKEYKNYCENPVEGAKLAKLGIKGAIIAPMIFDNVDLPVSFNPPIGKTHLYTTIHPGREDEYGLKTILDLACTLKDVQFHIYGITRKKGRRKNLTFHGEVSNEIFNREIQNYHGALRLNQEDGFSETLAKSCLMGQYPVSYIKYPAILWGQTNRQLIKSIRRIKEKQGPNHAAREFWKNKLDESLNLVLNG